MMTGQKDKGIAIIEEAVKRDPLSPIVNHALAFTYFFAERYEDTLRLANKLIEVFPGMRIFLEMKGWATGFNGDWEAALPLFEEVHRQVNHPLKGLGGFGCCLRTSWTT